MTGARIADVSEGSKDAIVRGLMEKEMRDTGAANFDRVYFRKEDLAKMNEQERAQAIKLQGLINVFAKRAKARKEEKQKAESK